MLHKSTTKIYVYVSYSAALSKMAQCFNALIVLGEESVGICLGNFMSVDQNHFACNWITF